MSDTPRTDAIVNDGKAHYMSLELARELERELNAMTEERDELKEEVKSLNESIRDQEHHIMDLERLRRYSPGPHMGQD